MINNLSCFWKYKYFVDIFGISIDFSYVCKSVPGILCGDLFVILVVILLQIKLPIASAVF